MKVAISVKLQVNDSLPQLNTFHSIHHLLNGSPLSNLLNYLLYDWFDK